MTDYSLGDAAPPPLDPTAAADAPTGPSAPAADALTYDPEIPAAATPDVTGLITFEGVPPATLDALYTAEKTSLGERQFFALATQPGTYQNALLFAVSDASLEAQRAQGALAAIADRSALRDVLVDETGTPVFGAMTPKPTAPLGGRQVSGPDGWSTILRHMHGAVKRVPLYNSGIVLELQAPTLDDINTLLARANADADLYGQQFGSHFYMYADLVLKEAVCAFILPLVVASNLRNYAKSGVLLEAIKLPDYDVLLQYLADLMFPDGYENFQHLCSAPRDEQGNGCKHVSTVTANLGKMLLHNFAALSPAAITHMVSARDPNLTVTPEMLAAYHKELGFDGTTITFRNYRLHLAVPSLAAHLEAGRRFNDDLLNEVQADNTATINHTLVFRYSRQFLPWVQKIEVIATGGAVSFYTTDRDHIAGLLDIIDTLDAQQEVRGKLIAFASHCKLSHVGYPVFACPACGHVPETASGYFTLDPQHNFFTLSMQKLITR